MWRQMSIFQSLFDIFSCVEIKNCLWWIKRCCTRRASQNEACLWLPKVSGARGERAWTNKTLLRAWPRSRTARRWQCLFDSVCVCVCVDSIENITADLLKELITGGYMVYIQISQQTYTSWRTMSDQDYDDVMMMGYYWRFAIILQRWVIKYNWGWLWSRKC